MTNPPFKRPATRVLVSVLLAVAMLAGLVPLHPDDPELALQHAVAGALAASTDDRLLEVALEQYPERAPAIAITYGHLDLFRDQLVRFGPQVVPIVAAYQTSFTTADALQLARQAWHTFLQAIGARDAPQGPAGELDGTQLAGDPDGPNFARLTPEERGLIALLNMREEGNAFVGQWEITASGEAKRIPSRLVTLAGPELLFSGLTALERRIVQEKEIDWRTYGLAAVDVAAIASGVALLRFAKTAGRGMRATRLATGATTPRSGVLAAANVLGINAVKCGVPIGLVALMILHPGVFTHYLWILAEGLGLSGVIGPIVGWGLVIVPLAFALSWILLSARLLRFAGWLFAGAAWGCQRVAVRLAAAARR